MVNREISKSFLRSLQPSRKLILMFEASQLWNQVLLWTAVNQGRRVIFFDNFFDDGIQLCLKQRSSHIGSRDGKSLGKFVIGCLHEISNSRCFCFQRSLQSKRKAKNQLLNYVPYVGITFKFLYFLFVYILTCFSANATSQFYPPFIGWNIFAYLLEFICISNWCSYWFSLLALLVFLFPFHYSGVKLLARQHCSSRPDCMIKTKTRNKCYKIVIYWFW